MQVSSQEPPVARRWAQILYLAVASLILIGMVSEGVLIGPSLFAATGWGRATYIVLETVLFGLSLRLPGAGLLARLASRMSILSAVLCVLALIEGTSAALGRRVPLLAALHPATAMLMVGLTVVLLMHGRQLMRQGRGEMKPREGKPRALTDCTNAGRRVPLWRGLLGASLASTRLSPVIVEENQMSDAEGGDLCQHSSWPFQPLVSHRR